MSKWRELNSRRQACNANGRFTRSLRNLGASVHTQADDTASFSNSQPLVRRGTIRKPWHVNHPAAVFNLPPLYPLGTSTGGRAEGRYSHTLPQMVVDEDVKHEDPTTPPSNVGFTPSPSRREEKAEEADEVSVLHEIGVFLLVLVLLGFLLCVSNFLL